MWPPATPKKCLAGAHGSELLDMGISVVSLTTDRQAPKGCLSELVLPWALSEVQLYV